MRSERVEVEQTKTELAFKVTQTNDMSRVVASAFLGNLGEYMHVYGDDGEDDATWIPEQSLESKEDITLGSDSNHDSMTAVVVVTQTA